MNADKHEINNAYRGYPQDDNETRERSRDGDRNEHQSTSSYMPSDDDMSMNNEGDESMNDNDNNGMKISYPSKLTIRRVRGGKRRR